jgi:plastocyanin
MTILLLLRGEEREEEVPPMTCKIVAVGVLACITVAVLPFWSHSQEKESEHLRAEQRVVRIGANAIVPEGINIKAGEVVSWINDSGVPVWINFGTETVEKIRCKEPTRFSLAGDGSLTSGEVRPFEVAALCSFLPGEYHYTVQRQVSAGLTNPVTRDASGRISVSQ